MGELTVGGNGREKGIKKERGKDGGRMISSCFRDLGLESDMPIGHSVPFHWCFIVCLVFWTDLRILGRAE